MTKRKRWPNECEWARLDAIALAQEIDELSQPIFEGQAMTEIERVQRAGRIGRKAQEIRQKLIACRPDKRITA